MDRSHQHASQARSGMQVVLNHVVPEDLSGADLTAAVKGDWDGALLRSGLGADLRVTQSGAGQLFVSPSGTEIMAKVCQSNLQSSLRNICYGDTPVHTVSLTGVILCCMPPAISPPISHWILSHNTHRIWMLHTALHRPRMLVMPVRVCAWQRCLHPQHANPAKNT